MGFRAFRPAFALLALAAVPVVSAQDLDPQIEALIARMTIEEKAGQLTILADESRAPPDGVNPEFNRRKIDELLAEIRAGRVGSLMSSNGAAAGRSTQRIAVEESRLKIPLLFGADVIHGFRTVFPIPLGEASSFDPGLAEKTARVAAIEASASGLHWTFAPMVDIARDQRWGRVAEGAGEDVYLGKLFAAARVRGFQGSDLKANNTVLATPKHFAAYGAVSGGMDYNSVEIASQTLREVHLPPFKAAFDAGALSTMSSFNDINGVPASGNRWLMTDLLRGEWGFKGFVVSDYTADYELILHGYAANERQAARIALDAGVDMSMQSGIYASQLPKLVASGELPMSVVDESVRRVLRIKKALGLFDNPYRSLDSSRETLDVGTPAHRALAREAARESIVLLRNEGNLLPLRKSTRIALIGPLGDDKSNLFGPWTIFGRDSESITLKEGLALAGVKNVTVVKGAEIEKEIPRGIAAAVAAARKADVVLLAIGEGEDMSGEAQSRTDIIVPAPQQKLAEAVAATGKPVVVLLSTGRALALHGAVRNADAIVLNWFLGSESGNAITDVLFGDFNPSGRLPVSFPHESGQQPYYYNHRSTGRPVQDIEKPEFKTKYRETFNEALYPFGHGLGYSKFTYTDTGVSATTLPWDGQLTVKAKIRNAGSREGTELVQLYIRDPVASLTRPVRELKGFRKIRLAAGEESEVSFQLTRRDLEFVGLDNLWRAEPGEFHVWIAPSSASGELAKFELGAP
ncbi:beta-glucosidase [Povalibacter uvarum]|uniref:beta-glucosidase n=1 Tax=Povalibacter uvarum TaxID=732238 RepID=A0A841HM59_9GAMM|nr:beta-glucosidase BglX [Povalibacter uvarum]MBB6093278.1 beta-glucosidase [Povalibacter uvarum]